MYRCKNIKTMCMHAYMYVINFFLNINKNIGEFEMYSLKQAI